uniref:Uncharacterized protein n=2 Tax=Picea TaxID=3328 RepID=A0A117NGU9_PICGL|nr:hypothetical protein ABT39_MTgene5502 [Picea glauca]QHR91566.1 hypothetical protein Q903MT_gene5601 [Picea sitchensis]
MHITGIYRTLPDITAERTFPTRPSPPDLLFHPSIFSTRKSINYRTLLAGLLTTFRETIGKKIGKLAHREHQEGNRECGRKSLDKENHVCMRKVLNRNVLEGRRT